MNQQEPVAGRIIGPVSADGMRPAKHYAGTAGIYLARMHPGASSVNRAAMWLRRSGVPFVN
jgi:hypothetical protein